MAILGLINAESFSADRFLNVRRSVFYFYPNGAAPLIGLLSLMKDEVTNDPSFNWFEKYLPENWTTLAYISTTVPFYKTLTVAGGVVTVGVAETGDITVTAGLQMAVAVAANPKTKFRIGNTIQIKVILADNVTTFMLVGRVNALNTTGDTVSANIIGFTAVNVPGTAISFDSAITGNQVLIVGSAYAEGIVDESSGIYNLPINPSNYTQIFRKPFSITGTALKTSAKFDAQGIYPDESKENSIEHMREMEWSFIFGTNQLTGTAATAITRYTGGILYFLALWEAGTTYGNTAATLDSDDNKRVIVNASGTLSAKQYNKYLERAFRITNNKTNEKLALCGSGALLTLNEMYSGKTQFNTNLPFEDTYGMDITRHVTPFGTLYYKTHPLMSQNPLLRNNILIIDIPNLVYRYLNGRDTELLTGRQPNDADYRKDEWLTECGLELRMPASMMYIQNVTDWSP
jgi:hypothetical protein